MHPLLGVLRVMLFRQYFLVMWLLNFPKPMVLLLRNSPSFLHGPIIRISSEGEILIFGS